MSKVAAFNRQDECGEYEEIVRRKGIMSSLLKITCLTAGVRTLSQAMARLSTETGSDAAVLGWRHVVAMHMQTSPYEKSGT